MQDSTNFTLDSDEDDDSGRQEGHNVGNEKGVAMEHAVNGNGVMPLTTQWIMLGTLSLLKVVTH